MKQFNYCMRHLYDEYTGRILSRFGDQNWLPRSCDLIPLDFFLWGYLKSKVYVNIEN